MTHPSTPHSSSQASASTPSAPPQPPAQASQQRGARPTAKESKEPSGSIGWSRRAWLTAGAVGAASLAVAPAVIRRQKRAVFVARSQSYDRGLVKTIEDGLAAVGVDLQRLYGKNVLLKPNMVEPTRESPHMTTHPAVVQAAMEVFMRHNARVYVGEAPGHVRDSTMALEESRIQDALDDMKIEFSDLNYEDVVRTRNRGRFCELKEFYFPRTAAAADLIVSMPKLKTHHWMGMTASMKNLYGVIPGSVYGWPKNVLHHAGIAETVCDINRSLPQLATIVDGIDCMEGDGPILGTAKHMGVLVIGQSLPAVDATVARLMQLDPYKIPYLKLAGGHLGPIAEMLIEQRGEDWRPLARPFKILDEPHLQRMREGVLIS